MKDSRQALVGVCVSTLMGIILIGLSRTGIPSADNPFLSAQAFLTVGLFYLGFSLGLLVTTRYIVRLEKRIFQTPPPP
jgi:small basic protein